MEADKPGKKGGTLCQIKPGVEVLQAFVLMFLNKKNDIRYIQPNSC